LITDGHSFFFYSNEHTPVHIHVRLGDAEAVFAVEPEVELRESVGFNVRDGIPAYSGFRVTLRNRTVLVCWNAKT
jgi:hypothetical protein